LATDIADKLPPEIFAPTQLVPPDEVWANLLKLINHLPVGWVTCISALPILVKVQPGEPIKLFPDGSVADKKGLLIKTADENSNLIEYTPTVVDDPDPLGPVGPVGPVILTPEVPDVPDVPVDPLFPEVPLDPDAPDVPEEPLSPDVPLVPEVPVDPAAPVAPVYP
jgi:hypothetical protein